MDICKFKAKYFDYDENQPSNFECLEESISNGLCIFHNKENADHQKTLEKFNEKIKKCSTNKPLFCIGYNLPPSKIQKNFSKPVYFTKSTFSDPDFSECNFQYADFSGSKLQNANFSKSSFKGADFLGVEFNGPTNFSNTSFKEKVNFSESNFNEANFSNSKLLRAHFLGTAFKKADFSLSEIEESDFFKTIFSGNVNFIGAKIKKSKFQNTQFQGSTNFTGAILYKLNFPQSKFKSVDFDQATLDIVSLRHSTFDGKANFSSSELKKLDLFKVVFANDAIFFEADLNEVVFPETIFNGYTNFKKAKFSDEIKFDKTEFQKVDFSDGKFEGKTFFTNVIFNDQKNVFFDVENLGSVSFRNTSIINVNFGENVKWGGKSGFEIIDEEFLNESTKKAILESVIATYRNLRKNYELKFRYEEAKKFLEREVQLKKKYSGGIVSDNDLLEAKLNELSFEIDELKKGLNILKKMINNEKENNKLQK